MSCVVMALVGRHPIDAYCKPRNLRVGDRTKKVFLVQLSVDYAPRQVSVRMPYVLLIFGGVVLLRAA